jgi:nucleoside-diphosphate-sugar epimerase
MSKLHLVTGATGLLGSHLAEQLVQSGVHCRAIVRPGSETAFLGSLGVECVPGNLSNLESLTSACRGAEVVYHAAAKVGDWGTKAEFEQDTVHGTRNVAQACVKSGVRRLVHISSTSSYGHPAPSNSPIDETWPLGDRFWIWDDYTRAKVTVERELWALRDEAKLPLTIIRPSWLYGPRDRLTMRRIRDSLARRKVRIIGNGANRMNTVYAGSVAHACLLAANHERAEGQAYNVTNDGVVTQQGWFDLWAEAFGLPKPTRHVPYAVAFAGAFVLEALYRLVGSKRPPFITRYATWLLGRPTVYSTAKAERDLGWKPVVTYPEGVAAAVAWFNRTQPDTTS